MRVSRLIARFCVLAILVLTACGTVSRAQDQIDEAITAIGNSISTVQQESSAWRNELPQLQTELDSIVQRTEGQATADARKLLVDTSNEVRSIAEDTIKLSGLTAEQLVAKFGGEVRCNVDFAKSRVVASLNGLVDRLKFWQGNNHRLPPPPPHSVCQITPDTIELHTTGTNGTWSMTRPDDKIVGIYGYDFRPDNLPAAELRNASGDRIREGRVSISYVTRYQINLDFGTEDFSQMQAGSRYVLQWPDQPEPNTISVTQIAPSKLKILSVDFSPKSPRARVDLVRAIVTVSNDGGSDSRDFAVIWTPGPNDPVQSVTVPNLVAGETKKVGLPAYTYRTHGPVQTAIVVGNGSDSYYETITVTPYAINPHSQNVEMRGQWPDPGGEKGHTMKFDLRQIELGQDCVIDTTRGGGSFQVEDIDDPNIKYTIAWPAGYDFNFGGNIIWRSLSSVHATFDAQARLVKAAVTLKGLGGHGLIAIRGPERFQGDFTVYSLCPT